MYIFKLMLVVLVLFISMPAMAEKLVSPALETMTAPQNTEAETPLLPGFEKPERRGPATATDKIVDRFMALNTNPEESAGVDFEEYFAMVQQRALDRFKAMDFNQDEEVTEEEYREFWKAQKAQYYRLKR